MKKQTEMSIGVGRTSATDLWRGLESLGVQGLFISRPEDPAKDQAGLPVR